MAATATRPMGSRSEIQSERPKTKQNRTDIWTSLLKQTQVAQSRDRSNAIAHRQLLICGGSPADQRDFLSSLTRPPPAQPLRRARNEKPDQKEKGTLALSNRYAYGYGHFSLFSAQQGGLGSTGLGTESEEVARLQCHCIPEPDTTYEPVLKRILTEPLHHEDEEIIENVAKSRPAIQILLSWQKPWKFLAQLKAWLQLLASALDSRSGENAIETLRAHDLSITVVVQHVEAQQELEREGWTEETFDYVCQVLRTVILPLHPHSALIYTPSIIPPQQPGAPLTEVQKVVFSALELNIASLSPRPSSSGASSIKKEDLLPRHNVVDRMNIVIPGAWDSAGKVRLLSETFSPEELLSAWSHDVSQWPVQRQPIELEEVKAESPQPDTTTRQAEEVWSAESTSPVSTIPSLPPSPSKAMPSAIGMFEARIVDPNAHKAPKKPEIVVRTRPEQDFLKEMKVELDNFNAKDREKNASGTTDSPVANRIVGIPTGESTGALDSLGDVSFNIGGVSYNSVSAEAAIERLKRPHAPGVHAGSSPSTSGSRVGTPRQPRRIDHDHDATPGATTPSSTKVDFPSEDLEKYFASLAKKAGTDSRQGTPSRQ